MNRIPVRSGHLVSIGYDVHYQTLEVEFEGRSLYRYFEVPEAVFEGLIAASESGESVGQYFDVHLKKPAYRYEEI